MVKGEGFIAMLNHKIDVTEEKRNQMLTIGYALVHYLAHRTEIRGRSCQAVLQVL